MTISQAGGAGSCIQYFLAGLACLPAVTWIPGERDPGQCDKGASEYLMSKTLYMVSSGSFVRLHPHTFALSCALCRRQALPWYHEHALHHERMRRYGSGCGCGARSSARLRRSGDDWATMDGSCEYTNSSHSPSPETPQVAMGSH